MFNWRKILSVNRILFLNDKYIMHIFVRIFVCAYMGPLAPDDSRNVHLWNSGMTLHLSRKVVDTGIQTNDLLEWMS